ncbi:MAG: hypothetical protein ABH877_04520, partial [bacterium]
PMVKRDSRRPTLGRAYTHVDCIRATAMAEDAYARMITERTPRADAAYAAARRRADRICRKVGHAPRGGLWEEHGRAVRQLAFLGMLPRL